MWKYEKTINFGVILEIFQFPYQARAFLQLSYVATFGVKKNLQKSECERNEKAPGLNQVNDP